MEDSGAQRWVTLSKSLLLLSLKTSQHLDFFNLWEPIDLPFCLNHFELFFFLLLNFKAMRFLLLDTITSIFFLYHAGGPSLAHLSL